LIRRRKWTDSLQHNATVITPPWPSDSESVLRVRLGVTVFCILALPRVTLGVTAKEDKIKIVYYHIAANGWIITGDELYTIHET